MNKWQSIGFISKGLIRDCKKPGVDDIPVQKQIINKNIDYYLKHPVPEVSQGETKDMLRKEFDKTPDSDGEYKHVLRKELKFLDKQK